MSAPASVRAERAATSVVPAGQGRNTTIATERPDPRAAQEDRPGPRAA
ncbi:hypothetical protein [Streptomyces sp. NPDC003480]